MRLVKQWNTLPREVVPFPFSEVFKTNLDQAQAVWSDLKADLAVSRRLD